MVNEGCYSLDFSEIYPNLEEIHVKLNNLDFHPTFFDQFEGDLGLSNNPHIKTIKGYDHFIKIIMNSELPKLTSLEMNFYWFKDKNFDWNWIVKFESLETIKIGNNPPVSLEDFLLDVANRENALR